MLVIKRRRMPLDTSLYIGTTLVSLLAITAFVATIHLMPLMKLDKFLAAKSPERSNSQQIAKKQDEKSVGNASALPETTTEKTQDHSRPTYVSPIREASDTPSDSTARTETAPQLSSTPAPTSTNTTAEPKKSSLISLSLPLLPTIKL